MAKRFTVLFFGFLMLFTLLTCRLLLLSTNTTYAQAAYEQSAFYIALENGRGNFFDCKFRPLTGTTSRMCALAAPTAESYRALFEAVPESERTTLYDGIQKSSPFLIPLTEKSTVDALTFSQSNRYLALPLAPHLLGYCNAQGKGISALEAAANTMLQQSATQKKIACTVNARGNFIKTDQPRIVEEFGDGTGIMITLDAALQRLCEGVAAVSMDKGSIVVMETATGRIRASVSMPMFDPENIAATITRADTALVNRSISSYNVGSVYKPLLAAAALENGISADEIYSCDGSITVDGHTYRCAYGKGHGAVDLNIALAESCNCYFVQLGLRLGGKTIVQYSQNMGFGESTVILNTFRTARGNFPTEEQLNNTGELASVSFGQGTLTASPVQIAAFMNTIANNGVYIAPTFVEAVVNEYRTEVTQSLYAPVRRPCLQPETAQTLQKMLVNVVENGLGRSAKPLHQMAGGKTGTAQTGRYTEDGQEIMDAWFAGFYPAENPQYTVAVLLDSGTHAGEDACKIFSQICSALHYFTQTETSEGALDNWEF